MSEFLNLILTGKRVKYYKVFQTALAVAYCAQYLFTVPLMLTALADFPAVTVVFACLLVVSAAASAVLSAMRSKFCENLILNQAQANEVEFTGEELQARKRLTERLVESYTAKSGAGYVALNVLAPVFYLITAVSSVLIYADVLKFEYLVHVLFAVSFLAAVVCSCVTSVHDGREKNSVYDSADKEITFIKKSAGYSLATIEKQARWARYTATRSQEIFLCDRVDICELRNIAKAIAWGIFVLFLVAAATALAVPALAGSVNETSLIAATVIIIAVEFSAFVVMIIIANKRRNAIFERNAKKLGNSETDELKRTLQKEFIAVQKKGNILFAAIAGGGALLGFFVGALSAINNPEINLAENAGGCAFGFLILFTIVACFVWMLVYGSYRSRVRPLEKKLNEVR